MDKLFLETPSLNRKSEALEYLKEHQMYNSPLNGTGNMDLCLNEMTYEEWLLELEKRNCIEYLKERNICSSKTYFVIRESDNKIVGMINIRYNLSDSQVKNGYSHIGYGIRPKERNKGYSKIALYLGLIEEQKNNENIIVLDCTVENIASNRTILALGGKLQKTEIDNDDNMMTNYYMIDVNNSINKYYEQYKMYLID